MGLTYEWKLIGLKKQNTQNVEDAIVGTNWKITATDEDGNVGTFTGATPFKVSQINTGSFINYNELTEDVVLGWVKNHVSGSGPTNYMAHINEMIRKEINSNKWVSMQVAESDLPWSPTSGSRVAPEVSEPAPVD
jgi:hypothetical protein